jgi:hypothetical protein
VPQLREEIDETPAVFWSPDLFLLPAYSSIEVALHRFIGEIAF